MIKWDEADRNDIMSYGQYKLLRDYFAGQALIMLGCAVGGMLASGEATGRLDPKRGAQEAYDWADAMLAERDKKKEGSGL